jgi:cellulose synthase/poly-beta-1,6-N-acetylglucosamine synthase-like glycosyltransferase
MGRIFNPAAWATAAVLLAFTARRWLFVLVALATADHPRPTGASHTSANVGQVANLSYITPNIWDKPQPTSLVRGKTEKLPEALLLAPLRNEAAALPDFLVALAGLIYPPEKFTVVLIDDGSTDDSAAIIRAWLPGRVNWHLLSLAQNVGKAQALNLALTQFPMGELVFIYDADERPQPEALLRLADSFADANVGGVSGRRAVSNPLASPVASYTTFEGLVHQWVTMPAKDRLSLAPAILGSNCAYRQTALAQVGYFKPGVLLEDSDLTVRLVRADWRTRFEPAAVSYHAVPESLAGYWRQHTRWARGFNEVAKNQAGATLFDRCLSWPLRLELLLFSVGYLDRVALLVAAMLALVYRPLRLFLGALIGLSLLTPLLQTLAALTLNQSPPALWRQLVWLPLFFLVDLAMSVTGLWGALKRSPQIWEERRARERMGK